MSDDKQTSTIHRDSADEQMNRIPITQSNAVTGSRSRRSLRGSRSRRGDDSDTNSSSYCSHTTSSSSLSNTRGSLSQVYDDDDESSSSIESSQSGSVVIRSDPEIHIYHPKAPHDMDESGSPVLNPVHNQFDTSSMQPTDTSIGMFTEGGSIAGTSFADADNFSHDPAEQRAIAMANANADELGITGDHDLSMNADRCECSLHCLLTYSPKPLQPLSLLFGVIWICVWGCLSAVYFYLREDATLWGVNSYNWCFFWLLIGANAYAAIFLVRVLWFLLLKNPSASSFYYYIKLPTPLIAVLVWSIGNFVLRAQFLQSPDIDNEMIELLMRSTLISICVISGSYLFRLLVEKAIIKSTAFPRQRSLLDQALKREVILFRLLKRIQREFAKAEAEERKRHSERGSSRWTTFIDPAPKYVPVSDLTRRVSSSSINLSDVPGMASSSDANNGQIGAHRNPLDVDDTGDADQMATHLAEQRRQLELTTSNATENHTNREQQPQIVPEDRRSAFRGHKRTGSASSVTSFFHAKSLKAKRRKATEMFGKATNNFINQMSYLMDTQSPYFMKLPPRLEGVDLVTNDKKITKEAKKLSRVIFDYFDVDSDGEITRNEVRQRMCKKFNQIDEIDDPERRAKLIQKYREQDRLACDCFRMFNQSEGNTITKTDMKKVLVSIFLDRNSLSRNLAGHADVSRVLHNALGIVYWTIIGIFVLIVFGLTWTDFILPTASLFLALSFAFGKTASEVLENTLFIVFTAPYGVGDFISIQISSVQYLEFATIYSISLFRTVVYTRDGTYMTLLNSKIRSMEIMNHTRSKTFHLIGDMLLTLRPEKISMPIDEIMFALKTDILQWLKANKTHVYYGLCTVWFTMQRDVNTIQLRYVIPTKFHMQTSFEAWRVFRTRLVGALLTMFQSYNIQYYQIPLPIDNQSTASFGPTNSTSTQQPIIGGNLADHH